MEKRKTGLVLEGGAMRGIYTAGVLDAMMEHEIQVDVFEAMHKKGYYKTPAAEMKKIDEVKQQFAQAAQ